MKRCGSRSPLQEQSLTKALANRVRRRIDEQMTSVIGAYLEHSNSNLITQKARVGHTLASYSFSVSPLWPSSSKTHRYKSGRS